MKTSQFIAKQQVKFYWKVVSRNIRSDELRLKDTKQLVDSFWRYEKTPRAI